LTYAEDRAAVTGALAHGGTGAEIGVFQGDFSAELLRTQPARLHLIDPWRSVDDDRRRHAMYGVAQRSQADMDQMHAGVVARFASEIATGQVVIHRAPSSVAFAALPNFSLDWVYIDGYHRYDTVLADLRMALAKTRPGGLICCDDHVVLGWFGDDIVRAVHDFRLEAGSAVTLALIAGTQIVFQRGMEKTVERP
jgi:hypothetical protein